MKQKSVQNKYGDRAILTDGESAHTPGHTGKTTEKETKFCAVPLGSRKRKTALLDRCASIPIHCKWAYTLIMKSLHSITLQSKSHMMDRGEVNKEKDAREEKLFENNTYASLTNCYSIHRFIKNYSIFKALMVITKKNWCFQLVRNSILLLARLSGLLYANAAVSELYLKLENNNTSQKQWTSVSHFRLSYDTISCPLFSSISVAHVLNLDSVFLPHPIQSFPATLITRLCQSFRNISCFYWFCQKQQTPCHCLLWAIPFGSRAESSICSVKSQSTF